MEKEGTKGATEALVPTETERSIVRGAALKAPAATAAIDGILAWLAKFLAARPNGAAGPRVVACLRLQKPAGTLKVVRALCGVDPKEMKVVVERAGLAERGGDSQVSVSVHDDGPILRAFQRLDARLRAVALAPFVGNGGWWGTFCAAFEPPDAEEPVILRALDAAARAMEDHLASRGGWIAKAVEDSSPRAPLAAEDFLREAASLLEKAPEGERMLGLVVYSSPQRGDDPAMARRRTRVVASRALRGVRAGDLVSVVGEDTVACALAGADAQICDIVAKRIRSQLSRLGPDDARGGFAHEVADDAAALTAETLERLRLQARRRARS